MTSLKDQEAQILADLTTIRELWDQMLPTLKAIPLGQLGGGSSRSSTAKAEDHNGDHNRDVDNLDIVMSDRGDITAVLQGWARVVAEDFDADPVEPCKHDRAVTLRWPRIGPTFERCATGRDWTKGRMHQITGNDTAAMIAFLERWTRHMTGHVAADDYADEIHACAVKVRHRAMPRGRDWMPLGDCPVEIEHADGTLGPCGGRVVAYPIAGTDRDPRCQACGTVAVVDWWISHMVGNPAAKTLVTATELIGIIAYRLHWTVTHEMIRQWAVRGKIQRAGRDNKGRTLYDHAVVVGAIGDDVRVQREKAGA